MFKQLPTMISELNKLGIALKALDRMNLTIVGVNTGNLDAFRSAIKGLSTEQAVFALASKGATEEQIRQIETEIDLLKYNRDRYKRNSLPYKELSERLKTKRKNLSTVKAAYRQAVQDIKGAERDKKYILKCLEIMG